MTAQSSLVYAIGEVAMDVAMTIAVFGSINADLIAFTPRIPEAGETLLGDSFLTAPGGKGANQAIACTKLGIPTHMIGRVGNDIYGQELLANLYIQGVNTEGVFVDDRHTSGVAMILVNSQGENQIVVVSGANGQLGEPDLDRLEKVLPKVSTLLLQLEIPLPAVIKAARLAKNQGVKVILDPAPIPNLFPEELYQLVDVITPNRVETSQLVGFTVNDVETAKQAVEVIRSRGVGTVIVKLGSSGLVWGNGEKLVFVPAFNVDTVDTVAAGDAFNGGLAVALAKGLPMEQAIIWGTAAGAIATTQPGAQSALPDYESLVAFLEAHSPENRI